MRKATPPAKKRLPRRPALDALGIEAVCDPIAKGQSLRNVAKTLGMNPTQVLRWIEADSERRQHYARARELQADHYADEIVELADSAVGLTNADVQAKRLAVDARKWVAAKLLPKKYGDRIETAITGELSLAVKEMPEDDLNRRIAELADAPALAAGGVAAAVARAGAKD